MGKHEAYEREVGTLCETHTSRHRVDIPQAFLALGGCVVCFRQLDRFWRMPLTRGGLRV